jgi:hypothetical protein
MPARRDHRACNGFKARREHRAAPVPKAPTGEQVAFGYIKVPVTFE